MATKIEKSTYPTGHKSSDFSCFGPPAVKDGEFQNTMICDLGSFSQEGKDTSKYYHAAVVQSKINSKWYSYFEWGRTGASNPQFQFQECSSKEEAQRDYVKQAESKNIKRGEWVVHQTLGKILQAKPGKDCYLVRPQSTRSTGLPDARTIKLNEQTNVVKTKTTKKQSNYDKQTLSFMKDLNVATISYTRGVMTDNSLPTFSAISEARDILTAALNQIKKVGDNIDDQLADREITSLTNLIYSRISKKKERNADPSEWLLTKNNIFSWQQDLDAFESALNSSSNDEEIEFNPFGSAKVNMEWISPTSEIGKFIYEWFPKSTLGRHGYVRRIKINNVWKVEREEEQERFLKYQKSLGKIPSNHEKPLHQPKDRSKIDLSSDENKLYNSTNTCLLMHGTRTVNTMGLLSSGFKFPKELVNVPIAGAMFSGGAGGIYTADDYGKSAGYTSLRNSYYASGYGSVQNRGAVIFLCDIILGNPHVAPRSYPYVSYPNGTHSIFGKAGVSGVQNNEFIILKKEQYKFRYLIEFDSAA